MVSTSNQSDPEIHIDLLKNGQFPRKMMMNHCIHRCGRVFPAPRVEGPFVGPFVGPENLHVFHGEIPYVNRRSPKLMGKIAILNEPSMELHPNRILDTG